jgi:hypothetical protein
VFATPSRTYEESENKKQEQLLTDEKDPDSVRIRIRIPGSGSDQNKNLTDLEH